MTGAVKDQPSSWPGGSSRVRVSSGTAARHHGSARGSRQTSVPATRRTPASGSSPASASKAAYDVPAHAVTRSWGSAR